MVEWEIMEDNEITVDLELVSTANLITELMNRSSTCIISMEGLSDVDEGVLKASFKGKVLSVLGLSDWMRNYVKCISGLTVKHFNGDMYQNSEYLVDSSGAPLGDHSDEADEEDFDDDGELL